MTKREPCERLLQPGVIPIIRAESAQGLVEAGEALAKAGIAAVEVTLTTPNALQVISEMAQRFTRDAIVGAGTVLDVGMARAALAAGAQFVVTPVMKPDIIRFCQAQEKPIVSGAFTPTEAYGAYEAGADFIKIFPAGLLGPGYIQNMRAPLPMLRIIPTGGVTPENAGDFIRAGCVAIGAGASLLPDAAIKARDWSSVSERVAAYTGAVAAARATA